MPLKFDMAACITSASKDQDCCTIKKKVDLNNAGVFNLEAFLRFQGVKIYILFF